MLQCAPKSVRVYQSPPQSLNVSNHKLTICLCNDNKTNVDILDIKSVYASGFVEAITVNSLYHHGAGQESLDNCKGSVSECGKMTYDVVTGASGYLAQHVIKQLLERNYKVIGTVRNQQKADDIAKQFQNDNLTLELVPDLLQADVFDDLFLKYTGQIKHVIHTASPCRFDTTEYENEMLLPAINGTKRVLESIKKYASKTVETVVYTSSVSALANPAGILDSNLTLTEESWNPDSFEDGKKDVFSAYYVSKTFAERTAWDFWKENKDQVKFELTTICPSYIFGPQAFEENAKGTLNFSSEIVNKILRSNSGDELDKNFAGAFVDVRDVARAHVLALEKPELKSKRLVLLNDVYALQDVADYINKHFPELRGKIATGVPGEGKEIVKHIAHYDNSKTKKLLGFEFISFGQAITDTVAQILKANN